MLRFESGSFIYGVELVLLIAGILRTIALTLKQCRAQVKYSVVYVGL